MISVNIHEQRLDWAARAPQVAGEGDREGTSLFHFKYNERLVPMRYIRAKAISRRRSKLSVLEFELGMISKMISRMIL